MDPITIALLAGLGGGALSSIAQIFGTQAASKAQTSAAQASINAQLGMFAVERAALKPYMAAGETATTNLTGQIPNLTAPINMDQATLQQTPGYQWNLAQGLKATQNGVGARGLGISGAAEKGAAQYASGLASSTYEQQFQNALANKQMTYNTLFGVSGLGESAAAGVGAGAMTTGSNIGQNLTNIGSAQAGADIGAANAVTGLGNSATQNALIYAMLQGK